MSWDPELRKGRRWILTFISASWLQLQCELQCQPLPLLLPCHGGWHLQTVNQNESSHSSVASVRILSQQWKKKLIYGAFLFFKNFSISIKQSIITKEYFFILNISSKKRKRYVQCSRKSDSIGRQIDLHEKKKSNEHVSWILSKIHNYMVSHINDYAKNITILGITP